MHKLLSRGSLFAAGTVALMVSGCASTDDVKKAQATADQAMSTAQQAQQSASAAQSAAQAAQQSADQNRSDIGALGSRVDALEAKHKRRGERG
jgi:polyhydroxyalkanoate synthesis regulator phasin